MDASGDGGPRHDAGGPHGPDPFGRALRDYHEDDLSGPLIQRDGSEEIEHPIAEFYFGDFDADSRGAQWLCAHLEGPLLDVGAGVGQHTLWYQDHFETVAVEVSEHLVETMRDRGVVNAVTGDIFDLRGQFEANRFSAVLVIGTQATLATSRRALVGVLEDFHEITKPEGTVVLDSYDPTVGSVEDLLGYRSDPTPGIAFRIMHFEYEDQIGKTLLFRLFSPDVLRETAKAADWQVTDVDRPGESEFYFRAALEKV